jgi:DNA-binding Xre family transcriptional regulator
MASTAKKKKILFVPKKGMDLMSFLREHRPEMAEALKRPSPKVLIASNLYKLRLDKGWSQKEVAERAKVGFATYQRIEQAQPVANPTLEVLLRLGDALGVELADLLKKEV